jgi:secondary thiamine-phosphate synthase enzyme
VPALSIRTTNSIEALDITERVRAATSLPASAFAVVRVSHTSAALTLGPGDVGMLEDFARLGRDWLAGSRPFAHVEHGNANGEAHLLSSIFGTSLLVPLRDGALDLGRWQRVLLLELDGPAERAVEVRGLG